MTFVPNMVSRLVDKMGRVVPPWNSFFQQFTQKAAIAFAPTSPFTSNTQGNLIFSTGAPAITLTRGALVLTLTGQVIIPVSIGDVVTWVGATTVNFLGTFSK